MTAAVSGILYIKGTILAEDIVSMLKKYDPNKRRFS